MQKIHQGFESIGGKWTELDLDSPLGSLGVDIPDRIGIRETFLAFSGLVVKDLFV